jgi:hypothetical protein
VMVQSCAWYLRMTESQSLPCSVQMGKLCSLVQDEHRLLYMMMQDQQSSSLNYCIFHAHSVLRIRNNGDWVPTPAQHCRRLTFWSWG